MEVLLALSPILLTLVLLLTRLPAWVAPAAGTAVAVLLALTAFGVAPGDLGGAIGAGVPTLLEILAIIAGGITLSRVMEYSGGHARLAAWLSAGNGPTIATALLMVHGVIPFLETVTGFGVSLIVGVPLLLGLGYTAFRSALISILALTIGPWGSMAPGTLMGARLFGLDFREIGVTAAVFNLPACLVAGVATVLLLRGARGMRVDAGAARTLPWLGVAVLSGVAQWALILGANLVVGTAPAGAVATFVLTVAWLLVIRGGRLLPGPGRDVVPYLTLMAGTVLGTTVKGAFGLEGTAALVGTPALWAFVAVGVGVWLLHLDDAARRRVPREAGKLWVGTAIPNALYVAFGLILSAGGVSQALAGALSGMGESYLVAMPFLGAFAGFITASNTGAMALIGPLQMDTGAALGVPPPWSNGLHNAAAGWGIVAGPARIQVAHGMAAGAQSPQMPGWTVTRRNLFVVLLPAMLAGILGMAVMGWFLLPR